MLFIATIVIHWAVYSPPYCSTSVFCVLVRLSTVCFVNWQVIIMCILAVVVSYMYMYSVGV